MEKEAPLQGSDQNSGHFRHYASTASRMLRRRLPPTGHLMTSRKLWLRTTPSVDVDAVLTFPPDTPEATVLWLKSKLDQVEGLVVRMRAVALTRGTKTSLNCHAFLLSVTPNGCLRGMEQMRMPKRVRPELGGGREEFRLKNANRFEHSSCLKQFVSVQERQSVVKYLVEGVRAGGDESVVSVGKNLKEKVVKFRENEAIVPKALSKGVVLQFFPLHEADALARLKSNWVNALLRPQPLDDIADYFGLKIGFYFAWLGHYTSALFMPAVVGGLVWFFLWGRAELLEDVGFVLFAFFNVVWSTLYLESWKRRQAELAFRWGGADKPNELLDEPRPLYRGEETVNEITGRPDICYPEWRRTLFRYCVTVPVVATALIVVLVIVLLILELQQWWDGVIERRGYYSVLRYLPKILLAVVIHGLDAVYSEIAVWLNDQENYRTACQYENKLVVKRALFQFVNSFLALFYTAFYLQDMDKLRELLAALLITRQALGNLKESGVPYIKKQLRLAQMSFQRFGALSPNEEDKKENKKSNNDESVQKEHERQVAQEEVEGAAVPYKDTFEDYLEMLIQFGYVTLFSSAYPLAAFFAWINNLVEIRGDAFKLTAVHQRPFAQRVASIGTWQTAMEVMGGVGIVVNCTLIGLSGQVHRMMPNITATQTLVLIVGLEHAMLGLKFVLSHLVPDVPRWVATEMARIEHRRREVEQISHENEILEEIDSDEEHKESFEMISDQFDEDINVDLSEIGRIGGPNVICRGTQTVPELVLDQVAKSGANTLNSSEESSNSGPRRFLDTERFRQKVLSGSANELRSKTIPKEKSLAPPTNNKSGSNRSHSLVQDSNAQQKIEDVRKRSCDPSVPSVSTIHEDVSTADKMARAITDYDSKQLQLIRNQDGSKTSSPKAKARSTVKKIFLSKRMASDSDLWTNTKRRGTKNNDNKKNNEDEINVATNAQSNNTGPTSFRESSLKQFESRPDKGSNRRPTTTTTTCTTTGTATTSTTTATTSVTTSTASTAAPIVVNQVTMPESEPRPRATLSMVATSKRLASRMAAKRTMFGKKRSLSVSSFKLMPNRLARNLEAAVENVDEDAMYLERNAAKGELELLDVENLIDVKDVHNNNGNNNNSNNNNSNNNNNGNKGLVEREWSSLEARKNWRLARQTLGQRAKEQ